IAGTKISRMIERSTSLAGTPVVPLVADHYRQLVADGEIESDPAQLAVVGALDRLNARLVETRLASKKSALGWLFGKRRDATAPVKGLYIWGSVGRGKTMLMDFFFQVAAPNRKRRVHFHEFMADVHERIHAARQAIKTGRL